MQTCPRCGSPVETAFCSRCGTRVEREPARGSVHVQQGPKAVDRSQTTIDNSSHSSSQVDDHSVQHVQHIDNSRREVILNANDNRRWWSLSGSGWLVMVVAIVALTLFVWFAVSVLRLLRDWGPAGVPTAAAPSAPVVLQPGPEPSRAEQVRTPRPGPERPSAPREEATASQPSSLESQSPARPEPSRTERHGPQPIDTTGRTEPPPRTALPMASSGGAPVSPAPSPPRRLDPADFINRGEVRPGVTAVVMVDERRELDPKLTQQIAEAVPGGSSGFFKPAFVREGMFSRVHDGDADVLRDLGVPTEVSRVVLGLRSMSSFRQVEVAGQRMVRTEAALTVRVVRPAGGFTSELYTASEIGAGFDEAAAAKLATDNALKKLLPQLR